MAGPGYSGAPTKPSLAQARGLQPFSVYSAAREQRGEDCLCHRRHDIAAPHVKDDVSSACSGLECEPGVVTRRRSSGSTPARIARDAIPWRALAEHPGRRGMQMRWRCGHLRALCTWNRDRFTRRDLASVRRRSRRASAHGCSSQLSGQDHRSRDRLFAREGGSAGAGAAAWREAMAYRRVISTAAEMECIVMMHFAAVRYSMILMWGCSSCIRALEHQPVHWRCRPLASPPRRPVIALALQGAGSAP